ncbi:hypothetical protein GH714_002178 [Hevea brasiliensis]|uniref:Uncharacterized protein n=1 Tax=Hevea brasiliensis TaxID=3981 RepID=A0A6A6MGQ4_HEVBR|nr:hypothetical protein GH714_002178 [Hevea brasiliensis]
MSNNLFLFQNYIEYIENIDVWQPGKLRAFDGLFFSFFFFWQRPVMVFVTEVIDETIMEKLEIEPFSSTYKAFCVADMGCSVGPNAFYSTHNILDAVEKKFISEGFTPDQVPQFQVFFNDLPFNDFNTLFKKCKTRILQHGTKGRFITLMPQNSSRSFCSPIFKGHGDVLRCQSKRTRGGKYDGPNHAINSRWDPTFQRTDRYMLNHLESCLVDLAKEVTLISTLSLVYLERMLFNSIYLKLFLVQGLVSEALVDSFNVPMYSVTPKEMRQIVERNGCFSIERMEPTDCVPDPDNPATAYSITMHLRSGLEGVIARHFGAEIINELFERFLERMDDVMLSLLSCYAQGSQLTVILKRRCHN